MRPVTVQPGSTMPTPAEKFVWESGLPSTANEDLAEALTVATFGT